MVAAANATSVRLNSGGTIPAGGCTIDVNVTGLTAGVHTNNIPAGALQTNLGNNQSPANAPLTISTLGYISGKVFKDNNPTPNGTFQNGTDTPISGVSIELRSGANCSGALVTTGTTDALGNYLFSRQPLVDALLEDARRSTDHDFGRSIIPELVPGGRVFGYDFQRNDVPGVKPYEEHGYWRDVGTLHAYWEAHMDLLGEAPRFDLDNRHWPIKAMAYPGPPARFIGGDVDNAQIGESSLVKRATIRNSILGRSVWVNDGAVIEDSIVMDHTTIGKGARLRRAIIDRFNIIPADADIGLDPEADRRRYFVDSSGLVVVPRGGRREFLHGTDDF